MARAKWCLVSSAAERRERTNKQENKWGHKQPPVEALSEHMAWRDEETRLDWPADTAAEKKTCPSALWNDKTALSLLELFFFLRWLHILQTSKRSLDICQTAAIWSVFRCKFELNERRAFISHLGVPSGTGQGSNVEAHRIYPHLEPANDNICNSLPKNNHKAFFQLAQCSALSYFEHNCVNLKATSSDFIFGGPFSLSRFAEEKARTTWQQLRVTLPLLLSKLARR